MADATRTQLKNALGNAVTTAGGAVEGTTAIAKIAVEKATGITKTAVNAAGVLGEGTVKAAADIGNAAIGAGADIATGAVGATATITNAATQATSDIAVTALDTVAGVTTTTTEAVGAGLKSGVTLAGNTVTRAFNGIDNVGAIIAGKGSNIVQSTLQKQGAQSAAIGARELTVKKDELLKAFQDIQRLVGDALSTLSGVQKTALAGKINIYKRAKCGFFRRMTGFCDAGTIGGDMKKADLFIQTFKSTLDTVSQSAKSAISTATGDPVAAFQAIEIDYNTKIATAVDTFVSEYKTLLDKYDGLARQALGISGGRRKTYRKKRRTTRTSRKRPSARRR
jgi:hypothetical protein